jgi:hypothetical protein
MASSHYYAPKSDIEAYRYSSGLEAPAKSNFSRENCVDNVSALN